MSKNRIIIVTVAWGQWHLNALQQTTVASLLAPGNLPVFVREYDVTYHIHLRKSEAKLFTKTPIYQRLCEIVDVVVETTVPEVNEGDPFALHHIAWHRGIEVAKGLGALVMFMPPDVVFADQSWSFLLEPLRLGKKSIMWAYSRVIEETILSEIMAPEHWPDDNQLVISKRELVRMSFEHLHPLMISSIYTSQNFVQHPEMIMWPVEGEGLAMRILASVNAIYDPSHFELNELNLLDGELDTNELFFVTDSDQLFAISLGPYTKDGHWYRAKQQAEHWRIGRWWEHFDSPSNDFIASQKIRIHHVDTTNSKWLAVEQSADVALTRSAYYREAHRIAKTMLGNPNFALVAGAIEHLALNNILPRHIKPNTRIALLGLTNLDFRDLLRNVSGKTDHKDVQVKDLIAALKDIAFYLPADVAIENWLIDGESKFSLSGQKYDVKFTDDTWHFNEFKVVNTLKNRFSTVLYTASNNIKNVDYGLADLLENHEWINKHRPILRIHGSNHLPQKNVLLFIND